MIKVINTDDKQFPIIVQIEGNRRHFTEKASEELLKKLTIAISNHNQAIDK